MKWNLMHEIEPTEEGEILFYSHETEERIGIVVLENKTVLLKRTDLSFDDIIWWLKIPKEPEIIVTKWGHRYIMEKDATN